MSETLENITKTLKNLPVVGAVWKFAEERPRLAAWIFLAAGIIILLLIEARDVGLLPGQWLALMVASVVVAGLCIWIVSWEDPDEAPQNPTIDAGTPTNPDKRNPA